MNIPSFHIHVLSLSLLLAAVVVIFNVHQPVAKISEGEDGSRYFGTGEKGLPSLEGMDDATLATPSISRDYKRFSVQHLPSPLKLAASDDPNTLNVHVVPHTHDDVGWLKTVEQYFFGLNMTIQHACVNDILDSVVTSLLEHPSRTFTYVEQKFFSMWWKLQDDVVKDSVRSLVANQQLSFVNGGWCMHDEAATHFVGMIDQTTLGHRFLQQELGVIPSVGWQLDPFGHSASQASYFTHKMGLDALYFGRIDYQDLSKRQYEQACEGLWNSSRSFDSTVFWGLTGSYEGNYGAPRGFCFDVECEDPYIIEMDGDELKVAMLDLLEHIRVQSDRTKGNHIMLTMGSDFQYQRAHVNYANLDLMVSSIMEMQRLNQVDIERIFGPRFDDVNIFYSSPNYYTECKYRELKRSSENQQSLQENEKTIKYDVKTDDFMPYSDCEHCFWTGYFTSRASLKRLERVASSFLLSTRQIESMLDYTGKQDPFQCPHAFRELEDASGVAQHHDGVSGTSKQHVADDYAKLLDKGIQRVAGCATRKIRRLLFGDNSTDFLTDLTYCQLLNETKCSVSEEATRQHGQDTYVVVYNGLAQTKTTVVHLPVSQKASYKVESIGKDEDSDGMIYQAIPAGTPDWGGAPYRIPILAADLPALGANVYKVSLFGNSSQSIPMSKSTALSRSLTVAQQEKEVVASNEFFTVVFERATGKLREMKTPNITMKLEQAWGYYTSYDRKFDAPSDNKEDPRSKNNQNSGAYIFRPSSQGQKPLMLKQTSAIFYNTTFGFEVHVQFEVPWIKTITRVSAKRPYLEVEYNIGPVPADDGRGKEVITQLKTPLANGGRFFTDSNGREFIERKVNHRGTWDLNVFEPVAGNYYPVNAAVFIEDGSGASLVVANDRSQGGTSLEDGTLELMVQRRTMADDWRGVDEPLNETDQGMSPYPPHGNATRKGEGVIIKGTHYIRIGNNGGAKLARSMMDEAFVNPLVFVGSESAPAKPTFIRSDISGLQDKIPPNVMLITRSLVYNTDSSDTSMVLLRLGHQLGEEEDEILSRPVKVDLSSFIPGYEISSVTEMTLSANQHYSQWVARKFDWAGLPFTDKRNHSNVTMIRLSPMDIRTFLITVRKP